MDVKCFCLWSAIQLFRPGLFAPRAKPFRFVSFCFVVRRFTSEQFHSVSTLTANRFVSFRFTPCFRRFVSFRFEVCVTCVVLVLPHFIDRFRFVSLRVHTVSYRFLSQSSPLRSVSLCYVSNRFVSIVSFCFEVLHRALLKGGFGQGS